MSDVGGHQLLLSGSKAGDSGYLVHAADWIARFTADLGIDSGVFVPFAAVTQSYAAYHGRVAKVFDRLGVRLDAIHKTSDPHAAIANASLIVVGGGNTFALTARLQAENLMIALAERADRAAYIGWSAGANIAAPSLATTNDMPIVEPASFATLGLVPFQINPHYIEGTPAGHHGESRAQRLAEYTSLNPTRSVVALPEGRALERHGRSLMLRGGSAWRIDDRGYSELSPDIELADTLLGLDSSTSDARSYDFSQSNTDR